MSLAAGGSQLGLPNQLGNCFKVLLDDSTAADVAFELQSPADVASGLQQYSATIIWAHASIIAARCPKLYDAIQSAQQQQSCQASHVHSEPAKPANHSVRSSKVITVRLGKQVLAAPFRQVLQYIYTGHIEAPVDKGPVHQLAQALGLKQLAMLASDARPMPGAIYSHYSLKQLFPQQAVAIHYTPPAMQLPPKRAEHLHEAQQHALTTRADHKADDSDVSIVSAASIDHLDSDSTPGCGKLHLVLTELTTAVADKHAPRQVPRPTDAPAHADILLVPSQTDTAYLAQHAGHAPLGLLHQHAAPESSALQTAGNALSPDSHSNDGDVHLVGLAAHAAVLVAASPYFAAMLSDRWQDAADTDDPQHCNRQLPVIYLPTHNFETVLCILYFCCTHELCLKPWACATPVNAGSRITDSNLTETSLGPTCAECLQARTAVKVAAAAEAWIMSDLHEQCTMFLRSVLERLPAECKHVLLNDMMKMQQWELVDQCS